MSVTFDHQEDTQQGHISCTVTGWPLLRICVAVGLQYVSSIGQKASGAAPKREHSQPLCAGIVCRSPHQLAAQPGHTQKLSMSWDLRSAGCQRVSQISTSAIRASDDTHTAAASKGKIREIIRRRLGVPGRWHRCTGESRSADWHCRWQKSRRSAAAGCWCWAHTAPARQQSQAFMCSRPSFEFQDLGQQCFGNVGAVKPQVCC